MRGRRRTAAGGVQADKQQRYVRLIAQGVGNSEACRLVGINRKTGSRWRYGRSVRNAAGEVLHYAPVKITPAKPRSPRYLWEDERIVIADLLRAGQTVRAIALELGRSPSTVSREIRRDSDAHARYRPTHAEHARAVATAKGRRVGRPVLVDPGKLEWAARLRDTGSTIAEIIEKTGIPRTSLYRHLPPRPEPAITADGGPAVGRDAGS